MIFVTDLGNFNTKNNLGVIFQSLFTTLKQNDNTAENILEYEGQTYYMEKGKFDKEFNKVAKNYLPCLLYSFEKSYDVIADREIDLVLGLPLSQQVQKDKIKKMLENKTFEYTFNGKKRKVKIRKVGVMAEGVSSFYMLPKKIRMGNVALIDIGGRTSNLAVYMQGKNDSEKSETISKGVLDLYDTIKRRENGENGRNLSVEEIDAYIQQGLIGNLEDIKEAFLSDLLAEIKFYINKIEDYTVCFTGGGAEVLRDEIENMLPKAIIMDDAIFTNVKGNEKVAKVLWGE